MVAVLLCVVAAAFGATVPQKAKPISASVVAVPSTFDSFMIQTGNIRVTFSDGHSELLTTDGNCTSPQISDNGLIGWIWVDKSKVDLAAMNREGRDTVVIQLPNNGRKEFAPNAAGPFIGRWSFVDGGRAVAIQSSGYHGPSLYIEYDVSTGKVIDHVDQYVPYDQLPSWAKQISDERPLN
ncbi:MAG TPA: hypothetical protein VFA90_06270 [Terriglobales bacterium]|nr:hypothetical protein [Terriglobales bacterium]